jgi:clan AA aspartic protease (TIGR02281 family)
MVLAILLAFAGGFAYFFGYIISPAVQITETISAVDKKRYEKRKQEKQKELEAKLRDAKKEQSAVQEDEKKITTKIAEMFSKDMKRVKKDVAGWVIITDPWGRQVSKFRAGLAGNGWLALPTRACLGGNRWHFYPDSGRKAEISGGLWIDGDKVGLWHLAEKAGSFDGPELAAWNINEPVSWSSLESANEYNSIQLSSGRTEGFFVSSSLPDHINEIGIFIQSGKIVGWSFGRWLARGYMWPRKAGTDMEYRTWVRYFYNMTFANGREEKFAMALAMQKGNDGLDKLASFIEGFRLQPKLAVEDTPYYLLPEEIVKQMRVLVTNAIRRGEESRVVDMLSSQVLKSIGEITLLMDVVPAIDAVSGFEAAIGEIEDSGRHIVQQLGYAVPALDKLHLKLYQDWLQSLVSARAVDEGWQTYNSAKAYYPDDPHIHLLGVELALLTGDWEEAERLLYMRNYPPAFQDRYHLLALRISEMKGREGKIVIRFPRGSNKILVTAAINGELYQDFLVDTGSTVVTIPSSMADALELEIVHGRRTMSTASGVVTVSEVIIDAMEIDGWVENDIRAVVLDMPDRPGLGLLGLNYLGRFQMDLNPEEGTLLLIPR